MSQLVDINVKATTRIQNLNLSYNNISVLIQNSINKLIGETQHQVSLQLEEHIYMKVLTEVDEGGTTAQKGKEGELERGKTDDVKESSQFVLSFPENPRGGVVSNMTQDRTLGAEV